MAVGKNNNRLRDKQLAFCNEYLIDLNATQAAIRAGYSKKTSYSIGGELLKKPEIRTYIQELMADRSANTLIDAHFVLEGLKNVAQRCLDATPVMIFDPVVKGMVQKKDEDDRNVWEFDSSGANRALELIGKHLGAFEKDNKQKDVTVNLNLSPERIKEISKHLHDTV
jgi:phage terminase small subunit